MNARLLSRRRAGKRDQWRSRPEFRRCVPPCPSAHVEAFSCQRRASQFHYTDDPWFESSVIPRPHPRFRLQRAPNLAGALRSTECWRSEALLKLYSVVLEHESSAGMITDHLPFRPPRKREQS